jgi:hypothetical protein
MGMSFLWKHALTIIGGLQTVVGVVAASASSLPPGVAKWVLIGSGALTALVAYIKVLPPEEKVP